MSSTSMMEKIPFGRELVVMGMAAMTTFLCLSGTASRSVSESGVIMQLPPVLGGMDGTAQPLSEGEKVILPGDTESVKMSYQAISGEMASAQIVLAGGEKRSIHRPEICLPAQGWTLEGGNAVTVKLSNGHELQVMRLLASRPIELKDGTKVPLQNVFLYWFIGNKTTTPYHLKRIMKTNLDMVFHNVNHRWAYVVVSAPVLQGLIPNGKNLEMTKEMLFSIVSELAPKIMKNP
jgi:hypothetical protein